jgi:signal peptidase I
VAKITEVPPPRKNPARELVETVIVALLIAMAIRTWIVETYRVEGPSMEATLYTNERVLVNKFLYRWVRSPAQGDIVVFQSPRLPPRDFIKRVVGVAGDRVELRDGKVYVNGRLVPLAPSAEPNHQEMTEIIVPADTVWVMGDNRNNSDDSRSFGAVPLESIRGTAFLRMWPPGRICQFQNPADMSGGLLPCP